MVVTGAAGFIGSHLAEALVRGGHEVLAVDALERSSSPEAARRNWAGLAELPGVTLIESDLVVDDLAKLGEADVVVHLAGRPGVRTSWGPGAAVAQRDNVTATRRLLEACAERRPKVVIASSSSVYGSAGARPHREGDPLAPESPYAVSKVEVERLAAAADAPVTVLRYFSVYGPRQRPDMAFHRFIDAALAGRALPVFGGGHQARSFTHVGDVVTATMAAIGLPGGETVNVGHPEPVSVRDAIALLAGILGVKVQLEEADLVAGDVLKTWADTAKAERLLGWTARIGLAAGLADQIAWQKGSR
ncbi:NAD-dependent epimerase/dehydratase family protein [Actinomadura macrotermitis]|uniref:dTDP-glucose 4,6-dehydratase n=1 Tax=Actinomadura macrotermitis TaxID=2585200 RepID=A0A7K0BT59_9ACTN|nr:NAD-dependent epimerase/dehydratase family protein [Actinomadura macrotermitis]MQY04226.1 dTDP-glucose 4,6-dehydratase [Actinomadura macrotermitis]